MKYAVVYDDENSIETAYHDTSEEAIAEFNKISDEPFDEADNHSVQSFTDERIAEIDAYSEAHPQ